MNGIPSMKDLTDEVDGIMEIAREAARHFFTREARPASAKRKIQELRLNHCIELFGAAGLLKGLLGCARTARRSARNEQPAHSCKELQ